LRSRRSETFPSASTLIVTCSAPMAVSTAGDVSGLPRNSTPHRAGTPNLLRGFQAQLGTTYPESVRSGSPGLLPLSGPSPCGQFHHVIAEAAPAFFDLPVDASVCSDFAFFASPPGVSCDPHSNRTPFRLLFLSRFRLLRMTPQHVVRFLLDRQLRSLHSVSVQKEILIISCYTFPLS